MKNKLGLASLVLALSACGEKEIDPTDDKFLDQYEIEKLLQFRIKNKLIKV